MTERRPGEDFSEWEKGFKQIEQGRPQSFAMHDFLQRGRELLDDSRKSGRSMFVKDDQNPGSVHFWVYPVEHWKVSTQGVQSLDLQSTEQDMQENGAVSSEEIKRILLNMRNNPKDNANQEDDDPRESNKVYTRDEFYQHPEAILAEIEDDGRSRTLSHLGHAEFRVIPIPLVHQIGFEEEFMREEEIFTQEIKRKREEIGLER